MAKQSGNGSKIVQGFPEGDGGETWQGGIVEERNGRTVDEKGSHDTEYSDYLQWKNTA